MPHLPAFDPTLFALARLAQRRARQRQRQRARRDSNPPTKLPLAAKQAITTAKRSVLQRQGDDFENQALTFLRQAGCQLLGRQLRCPFGEIDLVVQHQDILIFVEVRARHRTDFGGAAASVTPAKQKKLILSAQWWLPLLTKQYFQGHTPLCRIDVIAFESTEIFWHQDAARIG